MQSFNHYKAIYKNGEVHLLEKPNIDPQSSIEIEVIFPSIKEKSLTASDIIHKGSYFSIGGDALKDTEELYND